MRAVFGAGADLSYWSSRKRERAVPFGTTRSMLGQLSILYDDAPQFASVRLTDNDRVSTGTKACHIHHHHSIIYALLGDHTAIHAEHAHILHGSIRADRELITNG